MKKYDEMDRNIQLRSEEAGYRTIVLFLCVWIMHNCWQVFTHRAEYNPLPVLIVCTGVLTQTVYQMVIKRRMVAGDEEYKEPSRLIQTVIAICVIAIVIMSLGVYFTLKV